MKNALRLSILRLSILLMASLCAPAFAAQPEEITIGLIQTKEHSPVDETWKAIAQDMGKALGLNVNVVVMVDYAGIITSMQYNQVDLAWCGGKAAMEAVDRANGEVFMQTLYESGLNTYQAQFVVHKDSPLKNEEDLLAQAATMRLGLGDPNSTATFLLPYYAFIQHNIDPKKAFKELRYAPLPDNINALLEKQLDVTATSSNAMQLLKISRPDDYAKLKIIWTSPPVPADLIVWRKNLPEDLKEKLTAFFTSYARDKNAVAEQKNLARMSWLAFVPASNDDLLQVRRMELFRQKYIVEHNDKLGETEKEPLLKKINARLAGVNARLKKIAADSAQEARH